MVEKSYCGRRVWLLRKILLQFSIVFENLSQFVVEFSMPNVQKLNYALPWYQVSLAGLLGTQPASSSLERTGGLLRTRNVSDDSAGEQFY